MKYAVTICWLLALVLIIFVGRWGHKSEEKGRPFPNKYVWYTMAGILVVALLQFFVCAGLYGFLGPLQ